MSSDWVDPASASDTAMGCDAGVHGEALDAGLERQKAAESQAAKDWESEVEKLQSDGLNAIADHRKILWFYFGLLESTREAERRVRAIFNI